MWGGCDMWGGCEMWGVWGGVGNEVDVGRGGGAISACCVAQCISNLPRPSPLTPHSMLDTRFLTAQDPAGSAAVVATSAASPSLGAGTTGGKGDEGYGVSAAWGVSGMGCERHGMWAAWDVGGTH